MLFAPYPDVQEDRAARDERDDEGGGSPDADRQHPQPEVEEEDEGPDERDDAVVEGRRAQVHRGDPNEPQARRCVRDTTLERRRSASRRRL